MNKYFLMFILFGGSSSLPAQDILQPGQTKEIIIAIRNALESFRVDFSGYPTALDALKCPQFLWTQKKDKMSVQGDKNEREERRTYRGSAPVCGGRP